AAASTPKRLSNHCPLCLGERKLSASMDGSEVILVIGVRGEGENRSIGSQAKKPIEGNRGDIHVNLRSFRTSEESSFWHAAITASVSATSPYGDAADSEREETVRFGSFRRPTTG